MSAVRTVATASFGTDAHGIAGESHSQYILAYKTEESMIPPLSSLRINTLNLPTPYKACCVLGPSVDPEPAGQSG